LFYPVVIATVMLTIIGMIGGYLLSERQDRTSPKPSSGAGSVDPGESSAPPLLPVSGLCPAQTQEMAHNAGAQGDLSEVFKVTTVRKTVIWICQDDLGNLYYHANRGGEAGEWIEGKTALFLSGVTLMPDGSFQAVAPQDRNTFSVNRERLLIIDPDGVEKEQKVIQD
jgi:hypothetical protein